MSKWETIKGTFLAHIHIEGLDRMGILHELIQMISSHLALNIRRLDIEAENEVFHCDLTVLVEDKKVVNDLCSKVKKIDGVKQANRIY